MRMQIWILTLIVFLCASSVFAQTNQIKPVSGSQAIEKSEAESITKDGVLIGKLQTMFIKNREYRDVFRIVIILDKKAFPPASHFKGIGAIACKIYDIANDSGEKYTVHLKNHDKPELLTLIEVETEDKVIKDGRPRRYIIQDVLNLFSGKED